MEESNLDSRLAVLEEKITNIERAVESTRRYMQITFWSGVVLFVLPLIAIMFVIPWAFSSYLGAIDPGSGGSQSDAQKQLELMQELLQ